jgi:hypothetical protein
VSPNEPKHHHYIPQHYLRGFCADDLPGLLWVYTKGRADTYQTGITNIAKENSFYLPEVEQALASDVESPAEPVLKKIRARGSLTSADREILAAYLTILRKRVPAYRTIVRADTPEVQAKEFRRIRGEIADQVSDPAKRAEDLAEIAALEEAWQKGPPPEVQRLAEQPWSTGEIEAQLLKMHWYFLVAAGSSRYVTCDNPVFVFEGLGLNKSESELSCPVSRELALLVTGSARHWPPYVEARERAVQEINRRSVQNATSRVYYAEKTEWLDRMVQKRRLKLNKILS